MRNLLRDVNVEAISLVTKGANRKVFHLRKSEAELDDLIELPGPHRLVKADDWSAVYCVVAEPGWEEAPGIGAPDQAIPDVWADEDEIRKAAHRFMENGALVNCLHKGLERWGQIVENYIVPTDFDVDGQTIKKGSWVVAISPTPAGRDAIEKGEFTGISIEGMGVRELVEKAAAFDEAKHPRIPRHHHGGGEFTHLGAPPVEMPETTIRRVKDATGKDTTSAEVRSIRATARENPEALANWPKDVVNAVLRGPDHPANAPGVRPSPRPSGMPSTAIQVDGVWYRNQRAYRDSPAGKRAGLKKLDEAELAKQGVTGFLCSNCGHFMPPDEGRDRGACPSCRNRFRNAPVGYIAKAADLPEAIAKDALLVPNKPGVTNWIERAGGLPKYIADIAGDLISEKGKTVSNAIQMAIGIVRNWARGQGHVAAKTRAKAAAAVAEYNAKRAAAHLTKADDVDDDLDAGELERLTDDRQLIAKAEAREEASTGILASLGVVADDSGFLSFLRKLGRQSGMSDEDLAALDGLEKASAQTFAGIYAERDLEDELPDAFDALRSSIYRAFNPMPGEDATPPAQLIAQSLDEFKTWVEDTLKEATPEAVQKVRDDVGLDAIVTEAIAKAGADARTAQVKAAFAAAKKKHPDGVPAAVRSAIFKDPAKWLAANGDKVAKAGALADEAIAWTAEEAETAEAADGDSAEILKAARTFSAAERKQHAASGAALPDGSYPIPDKGALKRAMQSVGRAPAAKRAKVKAHIRRRAKALGATSMLSEAFAKVAAGEDASASIEVIASLDSEMGLTEEERAELDGLKSKVEELPGEIAKTLGETVDAAIAKAAGKPADDEGGKKGDVKKSDNEDDDEPTISDLQKSLGEFIQATDAKIGELATGIEKLGEGTSSQGGDPAPDPGDDAKKRERVEKAYKDQGVDSALVGLI